VYSQYHYCIPIPRRNWPITRWWNSFSTGTIKGSNIFKVVNKLWVLYAGSTKALHASFIHCVCLAQSIFVSKKMDDVQTQFGSFFFCMFWAGNGHYVPITKLISCIIRSKSVSGHHQTHLGHANEQLERNRSTRVLCCLP